MKLAPNVENYLLARGKLYAARLVSGVDTGEIDIGNVTALTLTPTVEMLDHYESMSGAKDKDKSAVATKGITGKFTTDEYSRENLRLIMLGSTEGTLAQATGRQINDPITARLDKWVKLTYRNIHTVVVTNNTGLVTYVLGTDYNVDADVGRIFSITGGAITDGQALRVDYNYDASSYPYVIPMEEDTVEVLLRFVGDPQAGPVYEIELWRSSLKPAGDVGWIGDEWSKMDFEFEILRDDTNHPAEPWGRIIDKTTNESVLS